MDVLTPEQRSWNMSRIRGKDTKPERAVRSMLHRMGYRFRLHRSDLPGTPDIVLPKYDAVIFVHGCFWHRHRGCRYASTPKTRKAFWMKKFRENIERDERRKRQLRRMGWRVMIIWECQIVKTDILARRLQRFLL